MNRVLVLLAVAALGAASCSGGGDEVRPAARAEERTASVRLPEQMLGLLVKSENVQGNLEKVEGSYLDSLGLFSFRQEDDLLRATLQIGRFNDIADAEKRRFRNSIIGQLGASVPQEMRLSGESVFLTSGNEQNIFSWFEPEGFFVLSVRSDYPFPRTLLRKLVESDIL